MIHQQAYKSEDNGLSWNDRIGCTCFTGCNDPYETTVLNFDTYDGICFVLHDTIIHGWTAWNIQGRSIYVNGQLVKNGQLQLPKQIQDQYYYIYFTNGKRDDAGWVIW